MRIKKSLKRILTVLLSISILATTIIPSFAEEANFDVVETSVEETIEDESEVEAEEVNVLVEGTEEEVASLLEEPEDESLETTESEEELDDGLFPSEEEAEEVEETYEEEPEEDIEVEDIKENSEEESEEELATIDTTEEIEDEEIVEEEVTEEENASEDIIDTIEEIDISTPSDVCFEETEEDIGLISEVFTTATPCEIEMPLLDAPLFGAGSEVCKIGGVTYLTLAAAIAAVDNNQTIEIINDVAISDLSDLLVTPAGKKFTIDFGTSGDDLFSELSSSNNVIFTVNSDLTVKNMAYSSSPATKNTVFYVTGGAKLTLINFVTEDDSNNDTIVSNSGGTVVIDGGNITKTNDNMGMFISRQGGSFTIKGNGTYTFNNGTILQLGTDLDNMTLGNLGTAVIENGTFSAQMVSRINGVINMTINSGTFNCPSGVLLSITAQGKTSSITINDITATVIGFVSVTGGMQNKVVFNDGKVKYQPGVFSTTNMGTPATDILLNNGMFGPASGATDIHDELDGLKGTGAVVTPISESGYTYKLEGGSTPSPTPTPTPTPTPIPTPHKQGGSSSGSSGSGSGGSPKMDGNGNILGPSGKEPINDNKTQAPDLTGYITVSNWDSNTKGPKNADIHYVQNINSFVRGDNSPVATEWVGVTGESSSKLVWYRTDGTGKILKNQFLEINGNIYYFNGDGVMVTGQQNINGITYNFDATIGVREGRLIS